MITQHVWRPAAPTTRAEAAVATRERPCGYLSCRKAIAEHERAIGLRAEGVPVIDWERYRACNTCKAKLGKGCRNLSGFVAGEQGGQVETLAEKPCPGRALRVGYARRAGEDRG